MDERTDIMGISNYAGCFIYDELEDSYTKNQNRSVKLIWSKNNTFAVNNH
jgi:hypothetical protein